MRHGQGPPSSAKPAPRYSAKSAAFSPGRDNNSGIPTEPMPKPPSRDPLSDAYSHVPGMSRSYTTRTPPKKAGFRPGTPGGDEPPARNTSAYFNVSRGATSREGAPPPSATRQPPSAKRAADPLYPFRNQAGANETYVNAARVSTPYATAGGEKTYFSSRPLGRSSSWKEGKNLSDCYESEPMGTKSPHLRPSSVAPDRNRSSSPRMRSRQPPSPLTSSSSSSDESAPDSTPGRFYGSARASNDGKRVNGVNGTEGRTKPTFHPSVDVEDAEDEDSARSGRSNLDHRWGNRPRKQQQQDYHQSRDAGGDHSEGFASHRVKHESQKDGPDFSPSNASKAYTPPVPPRPLNRPKSWHDDRNSAQGIRPDGNLGQPDVDRQDGQPRMYEPASSTFPSPPSSAKWSDQWPFMSPKKPRHPAAAPPPLWAIPSSLSLKQPKVEEAQRVIKNFFLSGKEPRLYTSNSANRGLPCSFTFPQDDPSKAPQHTPSLKSRSSESINVKFSPDWPSTFTNGTNEYFFSSSAHPNGVAGRRTSPSRVHAVPHKRLSSQRVDTSTGPESPEKKNAGMHPPPKDAGPPPSVAEEWAHHFRPAAWAYPPPPRSPAQKTMRKRQPSSRRAWKPSTSQFATPSTRKPFATVEDEEEEEENYVSSAADSVSSKVSGDESPMDIDSTLTPPPAGPSQINGGINGGGSSPLGPAPNETTPRATAPVVPPRPKSSQVKDPHLNLEGLKNVTPLAPSEEGLRNVTELHTTLPFESRPSNQPIHPIRPQPLVLPNPPKAPLVPEKLTQTAWERYQAHMGSYMFEWNVFNQKMLDHFVGRQASVEEVLKPQWMSAVGDGTERWGYKKYMQDLEEDFRVREHWDVSWERHRECMRGLGAVRERLLNSRVQV